MKHPRTIQKNIRKLRDLIEQQQHASGLNYDPITRMVAYAMEYSLRWALLKTVNCKSMDKEAIQLSGVLKNELNIE